MVLSVATAGAVLGSHLNIAMYYYLTHYAQLHHGYGKLMSGMLVYIHSSSTFNKQQTDIA